MTSKGDPQQPPPNVHIYGDVVLDRDELACASLGPKWLLFPELKENTMRHEATSCHTKTRYSRIGSGGPKDQELDLDTLPEEPTLTDEEKLITLDDRIVYNYTTKTLDLRKKRVTDLKDCPRLHLPPARPQDEEVELLTKETLWSKEYLTFRSRNCTDKGILKYDNMTKSERRGYKKLMARRKRGEIVISQTDKSCEITICSREAYRIQGEAHVSRDKKATWEQVRKAKNHVICHNKALNMIFNTETMHGKSNHDRVRRP